MATGEAPITRSDLREELDRVLQHYATKADLQAAKADIIKWVAALQLIGLGAVAGAVAAIIRTVG